MTTKTGYTLGIDIGGTKVIGGVVDPAGTVVASTRYRTPEHSASETVEVVAKIATELGNDHPLEAIGIAVAGYVDASRSILEHSPNLNTWGENVPVRSLVEAVVNLPVVVENDANAAIWGEYRFGAGTGAQHLALLTVGTGIGSGFIFDGRLYRGGFGKAGEFGHVHAVQDGVQCGCGGRGCFEQYASGNALERFARHYAETEPETAARLLELAGGDVTAIVGAYVQQAALAGDPAALKAFGETGRWLGTAFADLVFTVDPERIIVGGGVSEAGDLLMEPTIAAYRRAVVSRGRVTPAATIVPAALGNKAGLVGVADLARVE